MEIFHNKDRPNYDEIISYGPRWLTEYREMDANYRYAGWTLDLAAFFMEKIINNLFPEYADAQTILMLERLLRIEYDTPDVTLEERRRTVAAYFYGMGKLNRTSIINMAEKYTGCKCDVYWKGSVLYVAVVSDLDESILWNYDYNKLAAILRRRMPAHLGIGFRSHFKPIIIKNKTEVILRNVKNSYKISFWDLRCLDGSWFLDGSYNLDAHRRYGLALGMRNFYKLHNRETVESYHLDFKWIQYLQEHLMQGTIYHFDIADSNKTQLETRLGFDIKTDASELEMIENVKITSKSKDCWFLNGEINLDGSRRLNSIYQEEMV